MQHSAAMGQSEGRGLFCCNIGSRMYKVTMTAIESHSMASTPFRAAKEYLASFQKPRPESLTRHLCPADRVLRVVGQKRRSGSCV